MTVLAALGGAVLISFSAIFFALSATDPVVGAFFRMAYALPVLFFLWYPRRHHDRRPARRRWLAFAAGMALGLDVATWHTSINHIGTGLATLLANTQVLFVAVAAWLVFGEKPRRKVVASIPVVLGGVALVSGLGQADAYGANPVLGTLLALGAAVFYAVFLLGFRHANDAQVPPAGPLLEATAGAAVATAVVGVIGSDLDLMPTWPEHGWLIALALAAQVAGWLAIGYALPRLPAAETATIILLQPSLTLVWGALIFAERPSPLQILGVIIVLAGVGFVAFTRAATPSPAKVPG
ncbi:MAG: DMT family transporter [Acidimicrobiia bacterium]